MIWLAILALIVLLVFGAAIAAHLLFWSRNEVPYVATPQDVIEQIIYALNIGSNGTIFELGCGDGRLLEAISRESNAKLVGVDNNPVVLAVARIRARKNTKLVCGDILKTDLHDAARVYCYLSDLLMAKLEPRFERQLKPGTRVVSLQFRLPKKTPKQVVKLENGPAWACDLYIYDY